MEENIVLEGNAFRCDAEKNLHVSLAPGLKGIIPRAEAAAEEVRDIALISKVGKPVCFTVTSISENGEILLSRAQAQRLALENQLSKLVSGDIIKARVTHLERFGAFVDVGCGIVSMIGIENISVARIDHTKRRFYEGQEIKCIVCGAAYSPFRLFLSHRELLGSFEENAQKFTPGETVEGTVRAIKPYGLFIELAPNLSGLSEFREGFEENTRCSVYIRSILPAKMKIKLEIISALPGEAPCLKDEDYFISSKHLDFWQYSPEECEKDVSSLFTPRPL